MLAPSAHQAPAWVCQSTLEAVSRTCGSAQRPGGLPRWQDHSLQGPSWEHCPRPGWAPSGTHSQYLHTGAGPQRGLLQSEHLGLPGTALRAPWATAQAGIAREHPRWSRGRKPDYGSHHLHRSQLLPAVPRPRVTRARAEGGLSKATTATAPVWGLPALGHLTAFATPTRAVPEGWSPSRGQAGSPPLEGPVC